MKMSLCRTGFYTSALLIACVSAFPVLACEFEITNANIVGGQTIEYDVFSAVNGDKNSIIEIERVDGNLPGTIVDPIGSAGTPATPQSDSVVPCSAQISVAPSTVAALIRAGKRLNYELVADTQGRLSIGSQSLDGVVRNVLPGETRRWEFSVRIVPGQLVSSGSYAGSLLVSVGPEAANRNRLVDINDEELLRVQATVAASARITFAGVQGRNRVVDFGAIESGVKPLFQPAILVQSTAGYRLRFRSENKGQLVREGRGPRSSLPYDLNVSGESMDLGRSNAEVLFSAVDVATNRIPLEFSIPDARSKRAGVYRDRVVVDIVPMIR